MLVNYYLQAVMQFIFTFIFFIFYLLKKCGFIYGIKKQEVFCFLFFLCFFIHSTFI